MSDKTRDLIYKAGIVLFIAAVGVAVAFGVIDADTGDSIVNTVVAVAASALGLGVSGLAKKHIRQRVTQSVVTVQDALGWIDDGDDTHVDRMERERADAESKAR